MFARLALAPPGRKALTAVRNSSDLSCAPKMRASSSMRASIARGSPRSSRFVAASAPGGCCASAARERARLLGERAPPRPHGSRGPSALRGVGIERLPSSSSSAARCAPMSRGSSSELAASGTRPSARTASRAACCVPPRSDRNAGASSRRCRRSARARPRAAASRSVASVRSTSMHRMRAREIRAPGNHSGRCRRRIPRPHRSAAPRGTAPSACAASSAPRSASYMAKVMALRFSGRLKRTSQTPSARR